ncbi:hypothetical protein ACOMHN_041898 [Nucella lapillus]
MAVKQATSSGQQFSQSVPDSCDNTTETTLRIQNEIRRKARKRETESGVLVESLLRVQNTDFEKIRNLLDKDKTSADDRPPSASSSQESGEDKGTAPSSRKSALHSKPLRSSLKDTKARRAGPKKCVRFAEPLGRFQESEEDDRWERLGADTYAVATQGKDHTKRWLVLRVLLPLTTFLVMIVMIVTIILHSDTLGAREWTQLLLAVTLSSVECGLLWKQRSEDVTNTAFTTTTTNTTARRLRLLSVWWFFLDMWTLASNASLILFVTRPVSFLLMSLLVLRLPITFVIFLFLVDVPQRPQVCNQHALNLPVGAPPDTPERGSIPTQVVSSV